MSASLFCFPYDKPSHSQAAMPRLYYVRPRIRDNDNNRCAVILFYISVKTFTVLCDEYVIIEIIDIYWLIDSRSIYFL